MQTHAASWAKGTSEGIDAAMDMAALVVVAVDWVTDSAGLNLAMRRDNHKIWC
jgi:hypothetical protein